jgi:hypothetical protein
MKPRRIRLQRTRGWRKPAGAVVVSRPTKWGNPYRVGKHEGGLTRSEAVSTFRSQLRFSNTAPFPAMRAALSDLRGKDLACWCPLPKDGQPDLCHGAVLMEIANQ